VAFAGGVIGVCINLSNLYHTWEYSQETMRGKSELVKKNQDNQTTRSRQRLYHAVELWHLRNMDVLVPNTKVAQVFR
jgi:predicted methyltransferase